MPTVTPETQVITAEGLENACKQAVIVGTILSNIFMGIVKMIGMYSIFTKIDLLFNPHRIQADTRRQAFTKRVTSTRIAPK